MPFDPDKPVEIVTEASSGGFDPAKEFSVAPPSPPKPKKETRQPDPAAMEAARINPYTGIPYDLKDRETYMRAQGDFLKGVLSGGAQSFTGAGEMVRGPIGEKSAEATRKLREFGPREAQQFGEALTSGYGGLKAFQGITKLGEYIPKLPSIAGGVQSVLGNIFSGGLVGGGIGYTKPTGEVEEKKRFKEKQKTAVTEAIAGMAIGGGVSTVGELYNAYKYVRGVIDASKVGAQQLGSELGGQIAGARAGAEKEIAGIQRRLDAIADAQAQVEGRDAILAAQRATNQALTPEGISKIQNQVALGIKKRMEEAQKLFEEAGHSKQAAANLVLEQEALISQHKANIAQTAEGIVNQFKAGGLTENQFATMVSDAARAIRSNLTRIRTEGARWGEALKSAGDEIRVPTQSTLNKIETYRNKVNNPQTEGVLDLIKNRLKTVKEGGEETVQGLSVQKADSLRKYLDEIIEAKAVKVENGSLALPKETLAIVRAIRKDLTLNAVNAWEPYKQAMVKFAQLSKPLRPFERKGMLANVAKERADLEEQLITDGRIVADVLNRSRGGEFGIAQLIERAPEMKNALRAYWSRSLAEGKEKLTVGDFRKFLDSNEDILKRVGLYDDFAKAGNPLAVLNQSLKEAEGALPALKETVAARGSEAAAAAGTVKEQERLLAKAREREAGARDVTPRTEIEAEAEKAAAEARVKLGKQAEALEKGKSKPEALINDLVQFKNELNTAEANQIPAVGRKIANKLLDEGIINEAGHLELLQKLQILEQQAKTSDEARRLTNYAVKGAIGLGAGTAGLKGIQWGVGRIFTGGQ